MSTVEQRLQRLEAAVFPSKISVPAETRTKFPFAAKINGVDVTVWPDRIERTTE